MDFLVDGTRVDVPADMRCEAIGFSHFPYAGG